MTTAPDGLDGATEVVTRDGIRPLRDLATGSHDLLSPLAGTRGGLGTRGAFQVAEVRPVGAAPLLRVTLARGRSVKVVHATAGHPWFLAPVRGAQWQESEAFKATTAQLQPGDRLRPVQATTPSREGRMNVAVAQGFVFGDGTTRPGHRPATLTVYDNGKDAAMLPFFNFAEVRPTNQGHEVYGLPRAWRARPDLSESRSFLLSWLAGYFAADGTVSKAGAATLYSARREHVAVVRDVAAVCGVGYTPIRGRVRQGYGAPSELWQINLVVRDLPAWFFLIEEHARRVVGRVDAPQGREPWTVRGIESAGRVGEVFAVVVSGVAAFGLADDLVTGRSLLV